MFREDLEKYFDKVYPFSKIGDEYSHVGPIHIRFELGVNNNNTEKVRVNKAVSKAMVLFNDAFVNFDNEIWVLIYEFDEENTRFISNEHLHQQFSKKTFSLSIVNEPFSIKA